MKSLHIPRAVVFFILFMLAVFAMLYRPIDLKALVRSSSQGSMRTETIRNFASRDEMDYHILSMDSEEFQQAAELLSTVSCRKKLNQKYSSYTHTTFPVQSVTVSFYDDAENQKFLLTVYSDGVCILNSTFVSVKYPGGGAAHLRLDECQIVFFRMVGPDAAVDTRSRKTLGRADAARNFLILHNDFPFPQRNTPSVTAFAVPAPSWREPLRNRQLQKPPSSREVDANTVSRRREFFIPTPGSPAGPASDSCTGWLRRKSLCPDCRTGTPASSGRLLR